MHLPRPDLLFGHSLGQQAGLVAFEGSEPLLFRADLREGQFFSMHCCYSSVTLAAGTCRTISELEHKANGEQTDLGCLLLVAGTLLLASVLDLADPLKLHDQAPYVMNP